MDTTTTQGNDPPRRPIAMRSQRWAQALARRLTSLGISPNAISLTGLASALASGASFFASGRETGVARVLLLIAAALFIQGRLLCNMMDGMVAIEGGKRTPFGEIYNDMPDRFADVAILVGAGYSLTTIPFGSDLGWAAGVFAVLTAYVRLLGASMGTAQHFLGPMAKPHRMGTMTAAALLSTFEGLYGGHGQIVAAALVVVIAGSAYTFVRRTRRIVADVSAR